MRSPEIWSAILNNIVWSMKKYSKPAKWTEWNMPNMAVGTVTADGLDLSGEQ